MVLEAVVLGSVCFFSYKGAKFCLYTFCDVCHLLCGLSLLFICCHVFAAVACSYSPVSLPGSVCSQISRFVTKYLNLASVSFSSSFHVHSYSAGHFLSQAPCLLCLQFAQWYCDASVMWYSCVWCSPIQVPHMSFLLGQVAATCLFVYS